MNPIRRLVILGGGTSGWMTAAAISHFFWGKGLEIILVESDLISTIGVGEATIPHIRYFNQTLGIAEDEFMRATGATYKLGIQFSDWGKIGNQYIHPFGDFGHELDDIPFHHWWLLLARAGHQEAFFDYSISCVAGKMGRFDYPKKDYSILSTYSYAFHLDAGLYAKFLRAYSEKKGVKRLEGKVIGVQQDPNSGNIFSLSLDDGQIVSGDFFIDCSGFSGLLIEKTLKSGFESWKDVLICDSAIAVPTDETENPASLTHSLARQTGWQWRIPLQHRTGNGYVYAREFISDDEAQHGLLESVQGKPTADPRVIRFEAGRRNRSWEKNCVAIGLSSGFLEPLESTSIYLIQVAIMKLIELFPSLENNQIRQAEFNRVLENEYRTVKDFLVLHYHANSRDDSEFWRYCRNMDVPESLKEKIRLFKEAGITLDYQHGIFMQPSWLAVFIGQDIVPEFSHALTRRWTLDAVRKQLQSMHREVELSATRLPRHKEAITKYCQSKIAFSWPEAQLNLYGRE